jgi:hypothetical protein
MGVMRVMGGVASRRAVQLCRAGVMRRFCDTRVQAPLRSGVNVLDVLPH